MERIDIITKIQVVLADIIGNEDLELTEKSSPMDVEDWDSLAHFNLVMELQQEYGIKFLSSEIQAWKNVGDIVNSVLSHLL